MHLLRKPIFLAGAVAIGLAFGASSPTLAATHAKAKTKRPASALLILSAQKGTIAKTNTGYTLTLSGVDKQTLWFADRPDRRAGFVDTNLVIANWSKGFKSSQPNAGLVHAGIRLRDKQDNPHPASLELMQPRIQSNGDLEFSVRALAGDRIDTGYFLKPVLFIDGFYCPPCCCVF